MPQTRASSVQQSPDRNPLVGLQAQRFAQITNVPIAEVEGRSIAELSEALKWRVDPNLFLFRQICGQVVRWDPVSGEFQPVPFATVHVMDTECDFLGFFPFYAKMCWLYPIWCREEQITQVVTDGCGNFCVWIPWFDIEWVVRWRLERYCFPEVFVPISLGDVLTYTGVLLKPAQGSGPRPVELQQAGLTLARLSSIVGRETASKLLQTSQATNLGGQQSVFQSLLSQPAFRALTPPPASSKLLGMDKGADSVRGVVRGKAGRDYQLDLAHYVGPFPLWNCEWVLQEELVPILEVPDITFWVTQDIDGDGEQETIYSDGWFQIGWKSGPINDVTLHASPIARINGTCEAPPVGDCEQPEITFAGLMPATSAYIDTTNDANRGTSVRVNPPHADGTIRPSVFPPTIPNDEPAAAPFTGTVQLYGCTTFAGGEFYRLLYSYNKAALTPFTGVTWYLDPNPGPGLPVLVSPDAQGWYPILASPDAWWPPNELLDWPTTSYPDGLYDVTLQIGDASKTIIFTSATAVPFLVDNSAPPPLILSLSWRVLPGGPWNTFPSLICPIVYRAAGQDIEFAVQYQVSFPHLLKANIADSGCGGGTMLPVPASTPLPTAPLYSPYTPDPTAPEYQHWYTNPLDNTVSQTAHYVLPGSALAGCYGFSVNGYSRAFNPSGGDPSNPQANDWYVDTQWLNWNQADLSVAVLNV